MTALVRYRDEAPSEARPRGWVELMAPAAELAKAIAPTDFVPRALRHNAPAITAAILYGDEVGLGPMQSLAKIAVIDGRPFMAAEAQRALVYAAGHELWLEDLTNTRATWCGRRAGSDNVTRVTWTMDDAKRAHLDGKPNWRGYPRQMLSARASAELVRAVFADVVGGLAALEELDDQEPAPVVAGVGPRAAGTTREAGARRRRRPAAAAAAVPTRADVAVRGDGVVLPPLPGEESGESAALGETDRNRPTDRAEPRRHDSPDRGDEAPALISRAQTNRMMGLFAARGVSGQSAEMRAERLAYCETVVGRPLTSSKELTTDEADRVLDHLEADRAAFTAPDDEPPEAEQ
jgi:hypothetical protein